MIPKEPRYKIRKLNFELTCESCPEQYDVYFEGKQVAYVRLRGGYLSCECPDVNGELVYSRMFSNWAGGFTSEWARKRYLRKLARIIKRNLRKA